MEHLRPHGGDRVANVKRYRKIMQYKQTALFMCRICQSCAFGLSSIQVANFEDESSHVLNQEILAELERIKKLKRKLVGVLRAQQRAQREYFSAADHSFLIDYENKLRPCNNLQDLLLCKRVAIKTRGGFCMYIVLTLPNVFTKLP